MITRLAVRSQGFFFCLLTFVFCILFISGCVKKDAPPVKPDNLLKGDNTQQQEQQGVSITNIVFENIDNNTARLVIEGAGKGLTYTAFKLSDSSNLVIDIPDADMEKVHDVSLENEFVTKISPEQFAKGVPKIGRLMIGLKQGADYRVDLLGQKIVVNLFRTDEKTDVETKKEVKAVEVVHAQKIIAIETARNEKDITEIRITADGEFGQYDAFSLDNPPRLVVDISGVKSGITEKEVSVKGNYVKKIRIGEHHDKLRLVFESVSNNLNPYTVNVSGKVMLVSYKGKTEEKKEPALASSDKKKIASDENRITAIDIKPDAGGAKLKITTSKNAIYKVLESIDSKGIVIDLKDVVMPQEFRKVMDVTSLDTIVASVTSFETPDGKLSRIVVKLRDKANYDVVQEGSKIYLTFSEQAKKIESPVSKGLTADTTIKEKEKKDAVREVSKPDEQKPANIPSASVPTNTIQSSQGQWTGKKISLDFKDADIGNVIRLIAEVSQLNIILSDEVTGKVTLRLKDVPWDQAFDIILKSKGLGKRQEGNIIRIALMSKIKEEEKFEDLISEKVNVNYGKARDIEEKVKGVLSKREDASVISDERTNTVIIRDIPQNVKSAVELIKSIDTQTPQVVIEARIVEASSSFAKDLGVSWGMDVGNTGVNTRYAIGGATGTSGLSTFGGTSGQSTQTTSGITTSTGVRNFAVNLPIASPISAIGFTFGKLVGDPFTLDLKLMAAESAGVSKTISRPKIATTDNKEAIISQGKKIPYQTTSSSGTETKFIDATLKLKVTPHIIPDGTIVMKVDVTKNSKGEDTSAGPVILEKTASTEILLKDMETAVIGGIVETVESDTTSGMPWLKDLPVIGWLFKSKTKSDSQTELLIFITPSIKKEKL